MKKDYNTPHVSILRFVVDEEITTTEPTFSSEGFDAEDEVDEW